MTSQTFFCTHPSPIGALLLTSDGEALTGVFMAEHRRGPRIEAGWVESHAPFVEALAQLDAYFAGTRTKFDLPLSPRGSEFQRRVWALLREIPFGETRSYQALAVALGSPGAARAVGSANARNPLSIIVPCHRVIASSGALAGYAGGMERKRWLLAHEARQRSLGGTPTLAASRCDLAASAATPDL